MHHVCGTGDITPTHGNWSEQLCCLLLLTTASITWAHLLGTFCGIISSFSPEARAFRDTMDDLNRYMRRESFPAPLRVTLRRYFHQSKHLRRSGLQEKLISNMPPSLQGEVSWLTSAGRLRSVRFLRSASPRFMIELSQQLHAIVFAPSDVAPRNYMYIAQRGIAFFQGRVLTRGSVWGDDLLLADASLRSPFTARAINYLEAWYTSREEITALAQNHSET